MYRDTVWAEFNCQCKHCRADPFQKWLLQGRGGGARYPCQRLHLALPGSSSVTRKLAASKAVVTETYESTTPVSLPKQLIGFSSPRINFSRPWPKRQWPVLHLTPWLLLQEHRRRIPWPTSTAYSVVSSRQYSEQTRSGNEDSVIANMNGKSLHS